jgi:hypothetical protein
MHRALFHAIAILAFAVTPLWAEDLAAPNGDVILTFDLEMLEALAATTIETSTIWTDGVHSFQGVSLAVLSERLGISGTNLRALAVNDYAVEIPLSDAVENGPIIAYKMDGKTMSVRDKGPLWIIYPYDSSADYRTEVVYSRSIWQLDRIEAVN